MQLKTYNAQNAPHKVAPKVNQNLRFSFNSKGRFTLGRILYEKMGKPSGIVVLQDSQYPSDFYLRASKDPMAFQLKEGRKNQLYFNSNTLAEIVAAALKLTPLLIEIQSVRERGRAFLHRNAEAYLQVI